MTARMQQNDQHLTTRFATDERDLMAAQRLRYDVFVTELGGSGSMVDHAARLERDAFDPFCRHLVLVDDRRDADALDHVVGVYRLMDDKAADRAGGFYCAAEYDLTALERSRRSLLELGRSCVHPAYRGGSAMYRLWSALARHVEEGGFDILFGVASFHGTDPAPYAEALSLLHARYPAPPELRVRAREAAFQAMDLIPSEEVDRVAAMRNVPALIKAYLRLGGFVGEGAFIDRDFNTIDICLVMDTGRLNARSRAIYAGAQG